MNIRQEISMDDELVGTLAVAYTFLAMAPYDSWTHEGTPAQMAAYVVATARKEGRLGFLRGALGFTRPCDYQAPRYEARRDSTMDCEIHHCNPLLCIADHKAYVLPSDEGPARKFRVNQKDSAEILCPNIGSDRWEVRWENGSVKFLSTKQMEEAGYLEEIND